MVNYQHENVHYSVPDSLVEKKYMSRFIVKNRHPVRGRRKWPLDQRSYCGGDWAKLEHHLRTLSCKPGHCPTLWFGKEHRKNWRRLYDIHFKEDNRTFVLLWTMPEKWIFRTDIVTACKELTDVVSERYLRPGKGHAAW